MNKNFDYTSIPKQMLYCDRRHLDDFGVDTPNSFNYYIEKRLFEKYSPLPNYEDFATELFNCAYYILTMALLDNHPKRRIGAFWDKSRKHSPLYAKDGVMALAIVLQQMWVRRWDMLLRPDATSKPLSELYDLIEDKLRNEHSEIFMNFFAQTLQDVQNSEIKKFDLEDDFAPREITRRILKDSWTHDEWIERFGSDQDTMLEFIFAIGKNEEEMMLIASFMRDELHTAFDNGREHSWCFEYIEGEIHKLYHADEERAAMDAEMDAQIEEEYQTQFELDYYRDEFPKLKAENENLRAEIEEIKKKLNDTATDDDKEEIFSEDNSFQQQSEIEITDNNAQLQNRIAELVKEVEKYKALYEAAESRAQRLEEEYGSAEELKKVLEEMDWKEQLQIKERIIFFQALTGCSLSEKEKRYGNQTQKAKLIARVAANDANKIRSIINQMSGEIEDMENGKRNEFSEGIRAAALNVYNFLHKAVKGDTVGSKPYLCKQAMENINQTYQLKLEDKRSAPPPKDDKFLLEREPQN